MLMKVCRLQKSSQKVRQKCFLFLIFHLPAAALAALIRALNGFLSVINFIMLTGMINTRKNAPTRPKGERNPVW